mmetsp:Transcript_39670/g.119177  ORF Transcript_39670/g.119177 Transcript_39670/m.119177 type:complete len:114 (-) Transcript_39670:1731-2072(-)
MTAVSLSSYRSVDGASRPPSTPATRTKAKAKTKTGSSNSKRRTRREPRVIIGGYYDDEDDDDGGLLRRSSVRSVGIGRSRRRSNARLPSPSPGLYHRRGGRLLPATLSFLGSV